MQEIFDMIYYEGDILKTVCSIFVLILVIELIFGIVLTHNLPSTVNSYICSILYHSHVRKSMPSL